MKDLDAKDMINHMSLMFSYVKEQGLEAFRESILKDPKKVAEQLPKYLGKILGAGNSFFSGYGAGGPCELVTAPLLDSVGLVYPCLDKEHREKALRSCLHFLDGLEYHNSQSNVQYINEPALVGDIILNRALYWCGFSEYGKKTKEMSTWSDWEKEFLDEDGRVKAKSLGWLAVSTGWKGHCTKQIRKGFAELYPDITDRVKDAIAGWTHIRGKREEYEDKPRSYRRVTKEFLNRFEPEWVDDFQERLRKKNFIVLEETIKRFEDHKWMRERDKRESRQSL